VGSSPSRQATTEEEALLGFVGHCLGSSTLICNQDYMYELFFYYVTLFFFVSSKYFFIPWNREVFILTNK
jgi:hypothetical protein